MKKFIIIFSLISILITPSFSLAQTKFLSDEEQEAQEQVENAEEVQKTGQPEGAGLILGEADLNLEKPKNIPGEFAYSLRRSWENLVWLFTFRAENKVTYSMQLAKNRLAELEILLGRTKWQNTQSTLTLYKKHLRDASINFENLEREARDKIDVDTNENLLQSITILSIFAEEKDNSKAKKELKSALNQTLEFQKDIGL